MSSWLERVRQLRVSRKAKEDKQSDEAKLASAKVQSSRDSESAKRRHHVLEVFATRYSNLHIYQTLNDINREILGGRGKLVTVGGYATAGSGGSAVFERIGDTEQGGLYPEVGYALCISIRRKDPLLNEGKTFKFNLRGIAVAFRENELDKSKNSGFLVYKDVLCAPTTQLPGLYRIADLGVNLESRSVFDSPSISISTDPEVDLTARME